MQPANHEIIRINPELNMRYSVLTVTNVYTAMHWHDSIEILYVTEGELSVTVNNKNYRLHRDDFIVIDRKTIHSTSNKRKTRYLLIQIPYSFLKQFIPNVDFIRFSGICSLLEKDNRDILNSMRNTLSQLSYLYEHQYDGYHMRYFSLLFSFLDCLFTHYREELSSSEIKKTEKYIERLSLITEYVENHYQEPITLREAAQILSINPEYFSRFFKKYMGITFLEYVYSIRLQSAYQEIINTDLPIQEIQERNGFTSPKIFSRMFREQYGKTPREIRKSASASSSRLLTGEL
ncbi:MAG: AraC family transcriptional regulator [Lachnospiraceae bacterium]|nr:AraC family transcriptional regulator [Lachnospiraceae bacterium]